MNENRASVPGTAAADIVIEHGDRVVKAILAPKLFRAGRVGQPDRAVVVAVGGRIAPAQPGAQRADWQRRAGPPQAVRPVMYPHGRPEARAGLLHRPRASRHARRPCQSRPENADSGTAIPPRWPGPIAQVSAPQHFVVFCSTCFALILAWAPETASCVNPIRLLNHKHKCGPLTGGNHEQYAQYIGCRR